MSKYVNQQQYFKDGSGQFEAEVVFGCRDEFEDDFVDESEFRGS